MIQVRPIQRTEMPAASVNYMFAVSARITRYNRNYGLATTLLYTTKLDALTRRIQFTPQVPINSVSSLSVTR